MKKHGNFSIIFRSSFELPALFHSQNLNHQTETFDPGLLKPPNAHFFAVSWPISFFNFSRGPC